ncbi:MAG: aldose 1-epimerase [Gaiellales bacterium]
METAVSETTLDGSPAFALHAGELRAIVVPAVGMVIASLQHGTTELLGQRGGLPAYRDAGSSFGVPLLYPWANRLSGLDYAVDDTTVQLDAASMPIKLDGNGLPIHGLLTASRFWDVAHATADEGGAEVMATLDFGDHPELLAAFPFPHAIALTHRLDASGLHTTLTVMPTGDVAVPIAFGFHPYLAPGGDRAAWLIDLPVTTHARLDDRGLPTGATEPASPGPRLLDDAAYDDLYPSLEAEPEFAVETSERRLDVSFGPTFPCAQVYAPADADFICFEPMTAPTDALRSGDGLRLVEPGGSFTGTFRIDVLGV